MKGRACELQHVRMQGRGAVSHSPLAAKATHCPGLIKSDSPVHSHPWEAAGRITVHTTVTTNRAAPSLVILAGKFQPMLMLSIESHVSLISIPTGAAEGFLACCRDVCRPVKAGSMGGLHNGCRAKVR